MQPLHEAQIAARSRMYVSSAREAFERGKRRAAGAPELPAYPADGSTICKSRCQCGWQLEEVKDADGNTIAWNAYWRLSPVESCETCLGRGATWNPLVIPV